MRLGISHPVSRQSLPGYAPPFGGRMRGERLLFREVGPSVALGIGLPRGSVHKGGGRRSFVRHSRCNRRIGNRKPDNHIGMRATRMPTCTAIDRTRPYITSEKTTQRASRHIHVQRSHIFVPQIDSLLLPTYLVPRPLQPQSTISLQGCISASS